MLAGRGEELEGCLRREVEEEEVEGEEVEVQGLPCWQGEREVVWPQSAEDQRQVEEGEELHGRTLGVVVVI